MITLVVVITITFNNSSSYCLLLLLFILLLLVSSCSGIILMYVPIKWSKLRFIGLPPSHEFISLATTPVIQFYFNELELIFLVVQISCLYFPNYVNALQRRYYLC